MRHAGSDNTFVFDLRRLVMDGPQDPLVQRLDEENTTLFGGPHCSARPRMFIES